MADNFFKDPEWLQKFLKRIEKLMAENGIIDQKDFNERIGIQRALTRWKTGETTPGLKSCLAIKNAFAKSLDWIIFGEEQPELVQELSSKSYDARPFTPLEADLLNAAMAKMEEVLKAEKKQLLVEEKSRLLTRIYNDCAEDRIKPDYIMVKRYLWILN